MLLNKYIIDACLLYIFKYLLFQSSLVCPASIVSLISTIEICTIKVKTYFLITLSKKHSMFSFLITPKYIAIHDFLKIKSVRIRSFGEGTEPDYEKALFYTPGKKHELVNKIYIYINFAWFLSYEKITGKPKKKESLNVIFLVFLN